MLGMVVAMGGALRAPLPPSRLPSSFVTSSLIPRTSSPLSSKPANTYAKPVNLRMGKAVLEEVGQELDGQGRAKATDYFKPLVEGDILVSTNEQKAIVGVSYFLLAALAVKGIWMLPELSASTMIATLSAVALGYEFADFGSGVYHWAMDNYGTKNTPVFGTQIEAFQGHHELPWTITYRQVCNNIYKICQATSPFCLAGILLLDNPYLILWMTTAICFINLSQELHKWSHMSPSQVSAWINFLQDWNVIVSRKSHLAHHRPPFDGNYCIVSGHCNSLLDNSGFFRGLESIVFSITGNKPRCETNERLLQDRVESLGIKSKGAR